MNRAAIMHMIQNNFDPANSSEIILYFSMVKPLTEW